ncbi:MAG: NAD-dependent epimerase/dehydratase family protein [Pedococcus sp.]
MVAASPSPTVLFIGGTGVISTACARAAVADGFAVTLLNRGVSSTREPAPGAEVVTADIRDRKAAAAALQGREFDVVVDFLTFTTDQLRANLDLLESRFGQYVFISSASAYQTPPTHGPVTESTPLRNPFWQYSRDKIACEDLLVARYRDAGFPVTIVRPSHTYDHTLLPFSGGWTVVQRMLEGREVVVPGDGTSWWTLTHHEDFARAFVRLLDRPQAIGEAFHITSDEALTWDQIHQEVAAAAGVEARIVHIASQAIAASDAELGASLVGDKSNSMVFDNTKVRTLAPGWDARVPFRRGAAEMVRWHLGDPSRQSVDHELDGLYDRLLEAYRPRAL